MRLTAAFVAVGAALAVSAAPAAENLLLNPSFEAEGGRYDGTNPPGWERWGEAGGAARYTWDAQAGRRLGERRSSFALRVDDGGLRAGWVSADPVAIRHDREYVLAGCVSVIQGSGEVRLGVEFTGDEALLAEAWTPAVCGGTGNSAGDWVVVGVRARPPEGATHARVVCRADHLVGSAWFDDLFFGESGGGRAPDRLSPALVERFRRDMAGAERETAELRTRGRFWQAAEAARLEAAMWLAVGMQDVAAGRPGRGGEHAARARAALDRATRLARAGGGRPDPLPGGAGSVPVGVTVPVPYPVTAMDMDREFGPLGRFGITDVSLDFPWGLWEPAEDRFDFDLVDGIIGAAGTHGIKLYPVSGPKYARARGRVPESRTSLMGYTPWYIENYPEFSLENAAGERVGNCDGGFMEFGFVDPRRLAAAPAFLDRWERSLRVLVGHVRSRPEVGGWMLSSRPRFGAGPDSVRNLGKPGLLGHNPHYLEGFRSWLKEKYGTEAELRLAWGGSRASFARALPPDDAGIDVTKADPARRYRDPPGKVFDWLMYRAEALAGGLGWQRAVVTAESPAVPAVPLLAGFSVTGPLDPEALAPDVMGELAGEGPVAVSLAADAAPLPMLTHAQDVALALAGGTGRPVWVTDYAFRTIGMFGRRDRESLFPAPYVAPYAWGAVLSGARGFFFGNWEGRPGSDSLAYPGEKGSDTVTLSDEGVEVAKLARAMKAVGPWLAGAEIARPRYGVLVSWRSLVFDDAAGHHPLALLNALALAGIHEARIVTDRHLRGVAELPCEVLFAPYVTRLGRAETARLHRFVEEGGVLLADSYLASAGFDGTRRRPLSDGLGDLFGVELAASGTDYTDESTIGAMTTGEFRSCPVSVPISLSWYPGGYRFRARAGTRVLARYSGDAEGEGAPAITVAERGRGRAVLVPRVRLWPGHLEGGPAPRVPRAELRALKMGRSKPDFNGALYGIVLRRLLAELDALPAAGLVTAPVAGGHIKEQAAIAAVAGFPPEATARSAEIVRESQAGAPFLESEDLAFLKGRIGVDPDSLAPVRVNLLAGSGGGRMAVVVSGSSWARSATVRVPPCAAVADVLTGDEFQVSRGLVAVPLAPYQVRLLVLFGDK